MENTRHAFANGLIKSGEESSAAKLTAEQVLYIRNNPDGLNNYELAEKFGVDHSAIGYIQRGEIWKSVGGKIREPRKRNCFSEKQKEEIRTLYKTDDYTQKQLAEMFNTTQQTVSRIVRGK